MIAELLDFANYWDVFSIFEIKRMDPGSLHIRTYKRSGRYCLEAIRLRGGFSDVQIGSRANRRHGVSWRGLGCRSYRQLRDFSIAHLGGQRRNADLRRGPSDQEQSPGHSERGRLLGARLALLRAELPIRYEATCR